MSQTTFDPVFAHPPNTQTRLLGVIGDPIAHSLSPAMHNAALAWLGINMRYLAFHISPEKLADAVRGFAAMGMRGFNATLPHKETLLPLMDWIDPLALRIGAVNTVDITEDGLLKGYNTDAYGFTDALQGFFSADLSQSSVVVLGAGGAARGVVIGLLEAGSQQIIVANRTVARAEALIEELGSFYPQARLSALPWQQEQIPLENCDLLVNTTLLGLTGETIPTVAVERLPLSALVCDIASMARETPLLQMAKHHHRATLNGLGMLIYQGARAFEIWTGQAMPVERVRARLLTTR